MDGLQSFQFEANFSPMVLTKVLNSLVIFVESPSILPSMNKEVGDCEFLWRGRIVLSSFHVFRGLLLLTSRSN